MTPNKNREKKEQSGIRKTLAGYLTGSVVGLLAKTRISPDALTWTGFVLSLAAAALIFTGNVFVSGFVVLVAGFFDMLDGALARNTDRTTRFGGVLDSTLDRLSEAAVLLGVLYIYAAGNSLPGVILVGLAITGSLLVSYIRARAEALSLKCEVGIFTRPERVIVLSLGLLLSGLSYALTISLAIIVVFSAVTILQRVILVRRQTRNMPEK
jgi:CDP-diacylglycerol--glycerol-3-phosphate 3-phosphatidyltransferase